MRHLIPIAKSPHRLFECVIIWWFRMKKPVETTAFIFKVESIYPINDLIGDATDILAFRRKFKEVIFMIKSWHIYDGAQVIWSLCIHDHNNSSRKNILSTDFISFDSIFFGNFNLKIFKYCNRNHLIFFSIK